MYLRPALFALALLAACSSAPAPAPRPRTASATTPDAVALPPPQVPAARDDGRLPDLARPIRYALALSVNPALERFGGTQRVQIAVARPTRALVMHARGLTIRRVTATVAGGASPIIGVAASRPAAHGVGTPEELVLTFPREIPAGAATLDIAFDGEYGRALNGLYRVRQGADWYAFTQFEANDARRAFPCFDEPGFKVPWEVSLSIPTGQLAVSNMPEASRVDDEEGRTVFVFQPTPPTPSYLVAFAVGPFEVVEGPRLPIPIRAITTRGQSRLTALIVEAAAAQVQILADYFDRPFPYPKLDLLAVPDFGAGAMENPGLITFREELMLLDPASASTNSRRAMASVLAHELAHHWFGDLVTMDWWNDLWLNEGFATWMQSRVVDQWRPAFGARVGAVRSRAGAMGADALPAARAVRQPVRSTSEAEEAFDGITYAKGAAVLTMIEQWIGEDAFRNGVRTYVRDHAWGNATASNLFTALEQSSGRRDIATTAATFLDQPGVPLVSVELDCRAGALPSLTLSQSPYRVALSASGEPATGDARTWHVPVCVSYEADGGPRRACTLLTTARATAPLEGATRCPRWVYPNAGESGYYHAALTPPVRAAATRALLGGLAVPLRTGFADNAFALVRGGQIGSDEFLRTLEAYRGERSRFVLDSIIGSLTALYQRASAPETRPAFRAWIADFFRPIARELGWDPGARDDDDRRILRRAVLSVMGSLAEDPATLAEAERRAVAYLRDPRSVDSDIAALAVPLASRRANAARFDAVLAALPRAATPQDRGTLLAALSNFDDPALLRRALDASLTAAVRTQDVFRVIYGAYGEPSHRPVVIAWVTEHFDAIRARLPGDAAGHLAGVISGVCTREELAAGRTFWAPRVAQFEGGERSMRESVERAEQCIALRDREGPRLQSFFSTRQRPATR